MTRRTTQLLLLTLFILGCAFSLSGLWLWLLIPNNHQATLVRLSPPNFSGTSCVQAYSAANGLAIDLRAEWETTDDLVAVLNTLQQQGWRPSTNITSSVELLPRHQEVFDLWLFQARVFRGITLSYTPKRLTRYIELTALVLCSR